MPQGLTDLSSALALRLRDIARMMDRLDRLESGTGKWAASLHNGELKSASTEMALRALRVASDPTNFVLLTFLSTHESASTADLEKSVSVGRLALIERVNDLVQVGLAARNIDTDQIQNTAAGAAVVGLISSISEATAKQLEAELQKGKLQTTNSELSDFEI
jgi:hypothetical protein